MVHMHVRTILLLYMRIYHKLFTYHVLVEHVLAVEYFQDFKL